VTRGLPYVLLLVLLASQSTQAAESLGRLFFTPAQRNSLDAGKKLKAVAGQPAPSGPQMTTLNGVVTRSDGESTVWVNGRAVGRNGTPSVKASASTSDPAAARINLRDARNPIRLKVGQRFDRSTGKVKESYESGTVGEKQSASEPAQQKSIDRSPGADGNRDRTERTADQNSARPTND
jgi:hypothetical protein